MRKELLFFATAMLLLLPVLASCSSNDDNEDEQGWPIKELYDGRKVMIKETTSYPDSVYLNMNGTPISVPCKPVSKSELPLWVLPEAAERTYGVEKPTYIYQGRKIETGESLYILRNILEGGVGSLYNERGDNRKDDYYIDFLDYSTGWKCIFIVEAYELK